jgi:hypothetical protein
MAGPQKTPTVEDETNVAVAEGSDEDWEDEESEEEEDADDDEDGDEEIDADDIYELAMKTNALLV